MTLAAVDEDLLDDLVEAALAGAAAGEVTPPVDDGDAWTPARVAWLRSFHSERGGGLDAPPWEATWAVLEGGRTVGGVRLRRVAAGEAEVGIWLVRAARGRGVGSRALSLLLDVARRHPELRLVRADTSPGNRASQAMLRRLGFELVVDGATGAIRATLAV